MTKFIFDGYSEIPKPPKEHKINQGDFVWCKANNGGVLSFWGIYVHDIGIICLDGGGSSYINECDLYLYETYSHWKIAKRIKCENAELTIREIGV